MPGHSPRAKSASDRICAGRNCLVRAGTACGVAAREVRTDCRDDDRTSRRKLLHDALLFLSALEVGAVLISRNIADIDLLLRFRPEARVLLYG